MAGMSGEGSDYLTFHQFSEALGTKQKPYLIEFVVILNIHVDSYLVCVIILHVHIDNIL